METGYTDNGFIVDLTHASKISEIIYELSRTLEVEGAKNKSIYLKLGTIDLSPEELMSIQSLIELMNAKLACISTSSQITLDSATGIGVSVSEFTNEISAPAFEKKEHTQNKEVVQALDDIFGEEVHKDENTIKEIRHDDEFEEPEPNDDEADSIKALRIEPENIPTLYIRRTIRSGQSIASDGNIVIIGDVNPGAEIIAKGDVTVWGILAGIVQAGSEGNNYARIRALKLNPVQIRIGEIFARRPDTVNLPYIQKTSEYTPEEAFTHNGSIIIKKIHQEN